MTRSPVRQFPVPCFRDCQSHSPIPCGQLRPSLASAVVERLAPVVRAGTPRTAGAADRSARPTTGSGGAARRAARVPPSTRCSPTAASRSRPSTSQIDDRVAGDAAVIVDVRLDVAERERARGAEDRLAPVQSGIARAADRSPSPAVPIDEQHVIQLVDRFEAEDERRIAVLLEDHRRRERRLQAVRRPVRGRRRGSCAAWRRRAAAPCCTAAFRKRLHRRRRPAVAG